MGPPGTVAENDRLIGAEGTEPMGEERRSGEARRRDLEEQLDAALACTFPCSDPVGCLVVDAGSD
ncbi:MAG TPA: hypothetical protein VFL16_10825 [Steroidobacteraceae bacterium]|jgi:hypothetical protein|nr:hypothetical protein [Steroidobacteraceae bacterium]